jgi:hypothetical protein
MLTTSSQKVGGAVKKLIVAVMVCLIALPPTAHSAVRTGRVGWHLDRRRDRDAGIQVIFAGETLIGFYFRDDYKELLRSTVAAGRGRTFAWDKDEASLTRTPNGGTMLVVHERGKPEVSIPLKRDGE